VTGIDLYTLIHFLGRSEGVSVAVVVSVTMTGTGRTNTGTGIGTGTSARAVTKTGTGHMTMRTTGTEIGIEIGASKENDMNACCAV